MLFVKVLLYWKPTRGQVTFLLIRLLCNFLEVSLKSIFSSHNVDMPVGSSVTTFSSL